MEYLSGKAKGKFVVIFQEILSIEDIY